MRASLYFLIFGLLFSLAACSSSEETTEKDDVYIFDEIPSDTTLKMNEPIVSYPNVNVTYYVVQIGAFTTRERAETFKAEAAIDLKKELAITYSNDVNLFVVQLTPLFTSRTEAENARKVIWKNKKYNDAWIVTVNK
jgi:hypothetical protein